jgi:hypothetical protein
VHRDYAPKGVKFYFVYKTLAHPELAGDYVQPFTLEERLVHARQAEKQLGASIPWLVDAIDNRLKHALGNRPNSEFIIDPQGVIVRKRAWSHPAQVRSDLEQLVGPAEQITKEEDVQLKLELPRKAPAARGVVERIDRSAMQAIVARPKIEPQGQPFFAKLRAEADEDLMQRGAGKLYLGFHLDPFHDAHWNNLTRPLSFQLEAPEGVKLERIAGEAPQVEAASDADPREFLLAVESWPSGQPIRLTVTYFACVGDTACHAVKQEYELRLVRDQDAGGARGDGAGFWGDEFLDRMLLQDKDRDGVLNKSEVHGLVLPHFKHFDVNADSTLDRDELTAVLDWLNRHHQPGAPLGSRTNVNDR